MAEPAAEPDLPQIVLDRLTDTYNSARDPGRARAMASYMRGAFPFLGIAAPEQRLLSRQATATLPRPTESDLRATALRCWDRPEREYQYFACAYLRRYIRLCSARFLDTARELITHKSWWDTVDPLAAHVVGGLVARHRRLSTEMDDWVLDSNAWLVRTALLHQLHYREATDTDRLFHYCTEQSGNPDFFVRKAIGWALREYAKTDPGAVRRYVGAHRGRMSPLTVREALKNLVLP
ncbi:MAG: DNA alkylation repair protein [Actinocatenispora sp.]